MNIKSFKTILETTKETQFILWDGTLVPPHFHITEVGVVEKKSIDCGNQLQNDRRVFIQLWYSNDASHRLSSEKILKIIAQAEKNWDIEALEIWIEYQTETIGWFNLEFNGKWVLLPTSTQCKAQDACAPKSKPKIRLNTLGNKIEIQETQSSCCI